MKSFKLPYSSMSLEAIAALPVRSLADEAGAWLFLWATNRYVPAALRIMVEWGFKYRQTLVWHKPGASPFGGTFVANGMELLFGASLGAPKRERRWPGSSVITSSRVGAGRHSTKPAAFLDLVEATCPGPYVELFSRSPRLGWDSWGRGYEQAAESSEVTA